MRLNLTFQVATITLLLNLLASGKSLANTFTFTKIADSNNSGILDFFGGRGTLNDNGTVVFQANPVGVPDFGIFTGGSGDGVTTIVTTTGSNFAVGEPTINIKNTIAFTGRLNIGEQGTFIFRNGILTNINSALFPTTSSAPALDIKNVVSLKGFQDNVQGIFSINNGKTTTIADTKGVFSNFEENPASNNRGKLVFIAGLDTGGQGVFFSSGRGRKIVTISNTDGLFSQFFFKPAINDRDDVAFAAELDTGVQGIFSYSPGRGITTVVDSSGPFSRVFNPAINNKGRIAFVAELDTGGKGIFTGSNPTVDKVISTGDTLLTSTVVNVSLLNKGLNNSGQIAFGVQLADGTTGIFRAEPF